MASATTRHETPERLDALPLRFWRAWSTIDTAANLPGWWRWASALIAPVAPAGLSWWAAFVTHWPGPAIILFFGASLGVTLVVLNQLSLRAWLASDAQAARQGSRVDEPPLSFWAPREDSDVDVIVSVRNNGPADSFAAQIVMELGTHDYVKCPFHIRWSNSLDARQEILQGHSQHLHLLSFVLSEDRTTVSSVRFLGPSGSASEVRPNSAAWSEEVKVYEPVNVHLRITSATTGFTKNLQVTATPVVARRQFWCRVYLSE